MGSRGPVNSTPSDFYFFFFIFKLVSRFDLGHLLKLAFYRFTCFILSFLDSLDFGFASEKVF